MIRAGSLNTPITIQRQVTTTDAIGQPLLTWTDYAAVFADVRHLSGTESIKAGAMTSTVSASIRIRWVVGVTAGMRAVVYGVVYEIKSVLPNLQKRDSIDLVCEVTA